MPALLVLVFVLGITLPVDAATVKHSGRVVTIGADAIVVEEVGPWRVKDGVTQITRRTIALTPSTKVNLFMRVNVPGEFAGNFIEVALDLADLSVGDFVTCECVQDKGRLVATTVTVAELAE
jgi:hypothetical protein